MANAHGQGDNEGAAKQQPPCGQNAVGMGHGGGGRMARHERSSDLHVHDIRVSLHQLVADLNGRLEAQLRLCMAIMVSSRLTVGLSN